MYIFQCGKFTKLFLFLILDFLQGSLACGCENVYKVVFYRSNTLLFNPEDYFCGCIPSVRDGYSKPFFSQQLYIVQATLEIE